MLAAQKSTQALLLASSLFLEQENVPLKQFSCKWGIVWYVCLFVGCVATQDKFDHSNNF